MSTSFGWGKGGNVTCAGWQVTLCDPMWHVSSRSGVATLRTAIHLLLVIAMSVSVCVSVCLSAIISSQQHVRSSPNVLCLLPVAMARSCSGGVVIRYVLPVLWMTSYLLINQGSPRYDTRCYFNVRSKADMSQLSLPHGNVAAQLKRCAHAALGSAINCAQ